MVQQITKGGESNAERIYSIMPKYMCYNLRERIAREREGEEKKIIGIKSSNQRRVHPIDKENIDK